MLSKQVTEVVDFVEMLKVEQKTSNALTEHQRRAFKLLLIPFCQPRHPTKRTVFWLLLQRMC